MGLTGGSAVKNPAASGRRGYSHDQEDASRHGHKPVHPAYGPSSQHGAGGWQQERLFTEKPAHRTHGAASAAEKSSRRQTHVRRSYNRKPPQEASERVAEQESVDGRWAGRASSLDIRLSSRPGQGHLAQNGPAGLVRRPVPPLTRPSLPRPRWLLAGGPSPLTRLRPPGPAPTTVLTGRRKWSPLPSVPFEAGD